MNTSSPQKAEAADALLYSVVRRLGESPEPRFRDLLEAVADDSRPRVQQVALVGVAVAVWAYAHGKLDELIEGVEARCAELRAEAARGVGAASTDNGVKDIS